MDFTRQSKRAAEAHERFLVKGEKTCIDCHKGISHELPKTTASRTAPHLVMADTHGHSQRLKNYLAGVE